jgi:hypothetical protein
VKAYEPGGFGAVSGEKAIPLVGDERRTIS